MAAIHNLSDNLQGILVDLSEKIEKLEEKNNELEERTKELEAKEADTKVKIDEMAAENSALQERLVTLEQQMSADADSKLKELLQSRDNELNERLTAAEKSVGDHDKLFDRLESCEKKLASFYGEDTNILGRVGHLETRFQDFKKNEDLKLAKQLAGLNECRAQGEELERRVQGVEEGVSTVRLLCDVLQENKLEKTSVDPLLQNFKEEHRLLDKDAIVDVTALAHECKSQLDELAQLGLDKQSLIYEALDKLREDIDDLQKKTQPAHQYECFGSDQSVKIYQLEQKLAALEGITAESLENRLQLMDGRLDATATQMDRVLKLESFVTSNLDRVGTDYVHLSRLISDINEELSGHDQKMQNMANDLLRNMPSGHQVVTQPAASSVDDARVEQLAREVEVIQRLINAADRRMSDFAEECKSSVLDVQANADKKIDILAVWVSKNINLLAASMRKKFKQLLAGDQALLAGQSRGGHCLSCNQTKRPNSAGHPKTRVVEGKNPIFKITHVEPPVHSDQHHMLPEGHGVDTNSEATDGTFRMTVPTALRRTVSDSRKNEVNARLVDDSESFLDHPAMDGGEEEDESRRAKSIPARPSSAQTPPRKFFRNHAPSS